MLEIEQDAGRSGPMIGSEPQTAFQTGAGGSGSKEREIEDRPLPCDENTGRKDSESVIDEVEDLAFLTVIDLFAR